MLTRISVDDSVFRAFLELQQRQTVCDRDIRSLLGLEAYQQAIELMGRNWNIGRQDEWFALFSYALSADTAIARESLSRQQLECAEYVRRQYANQELRTFDYHRLVAGGEFVRLASGFAPEAAQRAEVKIILGVFCPNAGGHEHVFLDVPFAMTFSENDAVRLMAHEYNHILRSVVERSEQPKLLPAIEQALYWFESEGIADLCNFEATCRLYERFGYARPGAMGQMLRGIESEIRETSAMFDAYARNEAPKSRVHAFLAENVRFHVIAYFMASTLWQANPAYIQATLGDPFAFFARYQAICAGAQELSRYAFTFNMSGCYVDA